MEGYLEVLFTSATMDRSDVSALRELDRRLRLPLIRPNGEPTVERQEAEAILLLMRSWLKEV